MKFSIKYCAPASFNNLAHIENFCGYLFNMKPHQFNEQTKENFYIGVENDKFIDIKAQIEAKYPQNFNEKQFREIEFKKTTKKVQEYEFNNVFNDIFYLTSDDEISKNRFREIVLNTMPLILRFEDEKIKRLNKKILFITAHLNQDSPPHLHRIFAIC